MLFSELLKVVNKIVYWETALNILSYFLKLFLMFKMNVVSLPVNMLLEIYLSISVS